MKLRRRTALSLGLVAGVAAFAGYAGLRGIRGEIRSILTEAFGPTVGDSPGAADFAEDIAQVWTARTPLAWRVLTPAYWSFVAIWPGDFKSQAAFAGIVTELFIQSSTVIRAQETGEEVQYLGSPDPYANPCANPLSANWL